ncbi:MAG: hypothetical protein P0Y52_07925 [Candidatus Brevundimonas phytovorans]|nr:hypothetical protein [Brevundimonas sp.]WEK56486.1 MAG: hypothetical protein P0Y52_07925 [Brevundimonas sp.]
MANQIKGEVGFQADGQDYTLLLDFNALCELEAVVPGLMDGTAEIKSPSAVRAVFHAALSEHHPAVDVKAAGRIIHDVGIARAGELIGEAMAASFGKSEGKDPARPPKAR